MSSLELPLETANPIIFAPPTYQYDKFVLDEDHLQKDPIDQFNRWFKEAQDCSRETLPEAITFTTAELPSGKVSSRILLFKELDHRGFTIYSNWKNSRKAHDIKTNPHGAINFFWKDLQRQVRVEGIAEHVNRETSERYFHTRTKGSKIGSWASPQSQIIPTDREQLDKRVQEFTEKFRDVEEIPCPDYWGGLRIVPLEIEFWQGRPSRLHDRFLYKRSSIDDQDWELVRLSP